MLKFKAKEVISVAEWTREQLDAISRKSDKNILVAAAAGSGKTAVLVNRIIRLLTDETEKTHASEILVLTFTDAAASEMRARIALELDRAIKANPDNEWLNEQKLALENASISTIHSFCLGILKNNIHLSRVSADFGIISETENKILIERALDDVLSRFYARIDKIAPFRNLAMGYTGAKGDSGLRETIKSLYLFSKGMPSMAEWLNKSVKLHKCEDIKQNPLYPFAEKEYSDFRSSCIRLYDEILKIVDSEILEDHPYYEFFKNECKEFKHIIKPNMPDISNALRAVSALSFDRLPTCRGDFRLEDDVKIPIKERRDKIKKSAAQLGALLERGADYNGDINRCEPIVRTLKNIVLMLQRRHGRLKAEKSMIDFSDFEHEALYILDSYESAADKLRKRYSHILIDEYQDTSKIQEEIFSRVSRAGRNIFMVGDLKQSIYKFRGASPALFAGKYKTYDGGKGGELIRLSKNFRSRGEVIQAVNSIFSRIMTENTGGVDYNENEKLKPGAVFDENPDCKAEFLFTCAENTEYETPEFSGMKREEFEAVTVARRIRALVDGGFTVTDRLSGKPRKVRFSDINVLMRNTSDMVTFERVFDNYSIPVFSDAGDSYLTSVEVMTVLDFLRIIDNPLQDIPLVAVMRSPIFAFTAEELAEIRAEHKDGCFYDAVLSAVEHGGLKVKTFLDCLLSLRSKSQYMGIDELVWEIIEGLNYIKIAASMPGGELKQANLRLLFERAAEYERGSLSGLFNFISYIETLEKRDADLTPAKVFGEGRNAVRMMTIHKSKGLEAPVVIVANTSKMIRTSDATASIIWHEDYGLTLSFIDETRVKHETFTHMLMSGLLQKETYAEEMRLLYVALTRAREKLIISGSYSGASQNNAWQSAEQDEHGRVRKDFIYKSRSFRDWIAAALASNSEELSEMLKFPIKQSGRESGVAVKIVHHETSPIEIPNSDKQNDDEQKTNETRTIEMEDMQFEYPHIKISHIPIKMSVSELKRRSAPEEDYIPSLSSLGDSSFKSITETDAREKGTITHFIMQHMNAKEIASLFDVKKTLDGMLNGGIINEVQRKAVDDESIWAFFKSPLGLRLKKADNAWREFKFYMKLSANEFAPSVPADEDVLLQGVADCFFEEDGKLVLIDYKTDNVNEFTFMPRAEEYRPQLEYYSRGISEIFNIPVGEKYLYFLNCGKEARL